MADSTKKTQIVKLHHLRPAPGAKTAKTRVGRGEGSKGKTAGRGTKGTKARYQVAAGFEGGQMPIQRRLPKFGFNNPTRVEYKAINLAALQALSENLGASVITKDTLIEAGLTKRNELVKVLGSGELTAKIEVTADAFSKSAVEKIEAAGGKATKIEK